MTKTTQAQAVRGASAPVTTGNVVFLAGRKTAPAPAKPFSRTEIECAELGKTTGKDKALDDIFGALHQLTAAFNRYHDRSAIKSAAVSEKLASVMSAALELQFGGAA